ncbi:MAG: Sua5/YciO/YrdC/YwlC family protein [Solirubrobacterales bacterium]|nr:Sua5/YciO/YrdC/YwlC family protein [Solirubrobacterales bacterium]
MNDSEAFETCIGAGGLVLFPADTVYGLACDPGDRFAVERLYLLKRRSRDKPSAVMFFGLDDALDALPELGERTRQAMTRLPGAVSVLVPNPAGRFALACGDDVSTLGVRVVSLPRLAGVRRPVLQSSANRAGGPDPRRFEDVPALLRAAVDLAIDGGELPGTPSTVVDLRRYEAEGEWSLVRAGAVGERELTEALHWQYHFDASSYTQAIRADVAAYDVLQDEVARASAAARDAARILDLGTGTGETARRVLAFHSNASLIGIDENEQMLAVARAGLPAARVELRVGRIEEPLPAGSFDLVTSALCVHHLDGEGKARLFRRVHAALAPGGLFVMGDVVVPTEPAAATTPLTPGYDRPSRLSDQLRWLSEAGFAPREVWEQGDLAVVAARRTEPSNVRPEVTSMTDSVAMVVPE